MMINDRALVTGGAGFLGRHLSRALAEAGWQVTVLDDLSAESSRFDVPELDHAGIDCIRGSTLDRELCQSLVRSHHAILHLASVVGVERTMSQVVPTMLNLQGTLCVTEALSPSQVILFTSSADIYGLHSRLYSGPMEEEQLTVYEHPLVNRWIYPKIKALEENLIALATCRRVVIRVFNCYGPEMDIPGPRRVVPQFIENIRHREPIRLHGGGDQIRAFCHYSDTIRGILLALEHARKGSADQPWVFNIGGEDGLSIRQLAARLIRIAQELDCLESALPIVECPDFYSCAFDDTWHRTPDLSRAKKILGYRPHVGLDEGLRATMIQQLSLSHDIH